MTEVLHSQLKNMLVHLMRQKDTASRRALQKQNQMFLSLKNIKKKKKKHLPGTPKLMRFPFCLLSLLRTPAN